MNMRMLIRFSVFRSAAATTLTLLIATALAPMAAGQSTIVIAVSGEFAPDGDGGVNGSFSSFDDPVVNDVGQVAFRSFVVETSGGASGENTDNEGIFRGDGATPVVQIVRSNEHAPDGDGEFSAVAFPVINEAGQVAFSADFRFSAGNVARTGVVYGDGTTLVQIARSGGTAPGAETFTGFGIPSFNDAGEAAFAAGLTGATASGGLNRGIFRGDGTTLVQIARIDGVAPNSGTFDSLGTPALNELGQVAFLAGLAGTSGGIADNSGIFRGTGGGPLVQLSREGQNAPDLNGNLGIFFNAPALDDAGQAAFQADLTGTTGGSTDDRGIFRADDGALVQIARAGQMAPDGNGTFQFFGDPVLDVDELTPASPAQVAFIAMLTDTDGGDTDVRGVFRSDGVDLTPIARAGGIAPGGGEFVSFSDVNVNDAGQLAFVGEFGNGGGTGVFLFDDSLGLLAVARNGDVLFGSAVTGLRLSSPSATNSSRGDEISGLNDGGQVAYRFTLQDQRTGVALYTPVPEPAGGELAAAGGLALLLHRLHGRSAAAYDGALRPGARRRRTHG